MDKSTPFITPKTSVAQLLEDHPQAIPIFLKRGMSCVGCSMSAFETLEDAARIYGIDFAQFMAEIDEILKRKPALKSQQKSQE
jgi:hybrid cluster-associated redox disulfide protein